MIEFFLIVACLVTIGLFVLNVITLAVLCTVAYYTYRFSTILIAVDDALEESLDILDESYASISRILEKPIFFDSPEIRQAMSDIKRSRDSILYVANVMTLSLDPTAVIEEESQEDVK